MRKFVCISVSLIAMGLVLAGQCDALIDPESAAGIWLFDEDEGKMAGDSSANGNDGQFFGKPKWVEGKFGAALELNGESDWIQIADDPSLQASGAVTVMAWVKTERYFCPGTRWQGILAKSNNPRSYSVYTDDNKHTLLAIHCGGTLFTGVAEPPPLKEWSHVAGVAETNEQGGKISLFLNGNLSTATPFPGLKELPGDSDIKDVVIGRTWEDNRFFLGLMDEVAIFNVALTASEIKGIASNGLERELGMVAVRPRGKLAARWAKIKAGLY